MYLLINIIKHARNRPLKAWTVKIVPQPYSFALLLTSMRVGRRVLSSDRDLTFVNEYGTKFTR